MRFRAFLFFAVITAVTAGCEPVRKKSSNESGASPLPPSNQKPINYSTPEPTTRPTEKPSPILSAGDNDLVVVPSLSIPVQDIAKNDLKDTFTDSRSEGRSHDAIDIPAPQGTVVTATADGEIAKFFDSERGGITTYQYSADKKFMFYYAHLQRRADNVKIGDFVKQGTVLGYVGDTGNAGAGNFHLHFAIWIITDPQHDWDGTNINPYPLLIRAK